MDATTELIQRIKEAEHEAAAHYGITAKDCDRLLHRARTQIGKPLSPEESALVDDIVDKAEDIFMLEHGYL